MSDDMDWLSELVTGGDDEPVEESPFEVTPVADPFESEPPAPEPELDMVDDLRGEMAAEEEAAEIAAEKPRSRRSFGGLKPGQLFFLSVLLFLDVIVIGLLVLVMTGRIVLPI